MKEGIEAQLLGFILNRIDIGVLIIDTDLNVQFWNQFMGAHSGKTQEDVLGKNLLDLFPSLPARWFRKKIDSVVILKNRAFTSWQQRPYLFPFSHNRPVTGGLEHMYQNCTFMPLKDENGEVNAICITLQDVTDEGLSHTMLQDMMRKLERSSRTDGLTQLVNRTYWESCLSRECKRSERYAATTSLIMFDLDHFKSINDNFGHLAGDEVLRKVAEALRNTVRETDIAGRYGGEEFGVVVTETPLENAVMLAERIRVAMESIHLEHDGRRIPISVSLGVAEYSRDMKSYEQLIANADAALYYSKEHGRNRWTGFPLPAANG